MIDRFYPALDMSVFYCPITPHVRNEFEKFMTCGILAHGFARAKCECGEDFLTNTNHGFDIEIVEIGKAVSKNASKSNLTYNRKGRTLTAKQKEKSNEKRGALIAASAEAKKAIVLIAATTGAEMSVNAFLMMNHKKVSGCTTFKMFAQWKAEGYRVIKCSKSFDIWGSPRKAKGADLVNAEGETETGNKYKLFPVCSLFNESQVEKMEGFESEPTPPTPPKKEKEDQKDVNTNHVLDNGNNENLSEGESLEKAEVIEGEFIEADSPYVTSDYQERLEDRKIGVQAKRIQRVLVLCAGVRGTTNRRGCVQPTATGTTPGSASTTWASVWPRICSALSFFLLSFFVFFF